MKCLALFSTLLALSSSVSPQQLPLQPQQQLSKWNWTLPPSEDETGHLVFSSPAGLLQHWPNTFWRNGHTIILGHITPGTLLYHGTLITGHNGPPTTPEWAAFDVDMSIPYGHRLLTFAVGSEPLKIMYYDGSSAANIPSGTIDTQEISLHSKLTEGHWEEDNVRIKELCDVGIPFGIKGLVRMEYAFEVMICDFKDGLNLVSQIDVIPYNSTEPETGAIRGSFPNARSSLAPPAPLPGHPPWRDPPKGWKGSTRPLGSVFLEALEAGALHDHAPLPGVVLDYSTFLSFFDKRYTSLIAARRGVPRHHYRAGNISEEDAHLFQYGPFSDTLFRPLWSGSGINWGDVATAVVNRFAEQLEFLRALLNNAPLPQTSVRKRMFVARNTILTTLTPYMSNTTVPPPDDTDWLSPTIEKCSNGFTSHLTGVVLANEILLKEAVYTVSAEICRTMGVIWLEAFDAERLSEDSQRALMVKWGKEIDWLMEWLGWAHWTKCNPGCHTREVCSLPQWPYDWEGNEENYNPICVSRLELIEDLSWT